LSLSSPLVLEHYRQHERIVYHLHPVHEGIADSRYW
jgi:hypothetical protein